MISCYGKRDARIGKKSKLGKRGGSHRSILNILNENASFVVSTFAINQKSHPPKISHFFVDMITGHDNNRI